MNCIWYNLTFLAASIPWMISAWGGRASLIKTDTFHHITLYFSLLIGSDMLVMQSYNAADHYWVFFLQLQLHLWLLSVGPW